MRTWQAQPGRIARAWRVWLLLVALAFTAGVFAQDVRIGASTTVRFATPEQARVALSADDVWLQSTSDFQRAATMGISRSVSREQFQRHLASTAQAWSPAARARWAAALERIAPRLASLRVPLPDEILLVQTNGEDAANAPYTRANAIFVPVGFRGPADDVLMAHEIFHIVSRAHPALATRLYATLGFEPAGELQWPPEWEAARIANPDAPFSRHVMRLQVGGRTLAVMPLLVARSTRLSPGQTFFDVLDVRLLAVTPGAGAAASTPQRQADGSLQWALAERTPAFLARLGGNTHYIFHPEETAADNFAYLVTGQPVPNPDLLRQFEQILTTYRP